MKTKRTRTAAETANREDVVTDLSTLLRQRRSIRAFEDRPVDERELTAVLEAANAAPSAGNLQAYEVVLVEAAATRAALARAAHGQEFVAEAPVVLVFLADPGRSAAKYGQRGAVRYAHLDAGIACAFAHLRAADLGLASTWVGAFDDGAVAYAVGAPPGLVPVALLPIGHPAERPPPTTRRRLEDLVHRERVRDFRAEDTSD